MTGPTGRGGGGQRKSWAPGDKPQVGEALRDGGGCRGWELEGYALVGPQGLGPKGWDKGEGPRKLGVGPRGGGLFMTVDCIGNLIRVSSIIQVYFILYYFQCLPNVRNAGTSKKSIRSIKILLPNILICSTITILDWR